MRGILIGGSVAIFAFLASGVGPAAACDWGCRGPVYTYGPPPPIYIVPPRIYIEPPLFYGSVYYPRYRARYYGRPWGHYYGGPRGYYRAYHGHHRGRWRH